MRAVAALANMSTETEGPANAASALRGVIEATLARLNAGDPGGAAALILPHAEAAAASAPGCYVIGIVLANAGDAVSALDWFDKALALAPDLVPALGTSALVLRSQGRWPEAMARLDRLAALTPEDAGVPLARAEALEALGRLDEALAAYDTAARLDPATSDIDLRRGNLLRRLGRFDEALVCYDRMPDDPQACNGRGLALKALGRKADALAAFESAISLDPASCDALCNRATLLHEAGRTAEAVAGFDAALVLQPAFLPALVNRAALALHLGRPDQALDLGARALAQAPASAEAMAFVGMALQRLGRLTEALERIDAALARRADLPNAWVTRGNILQALDRVPEAIPAYEAALRLRPGDPDALSALGVAHKELGAVDAALACFDRVLAADPGHADARYNRAGALLLLGRWPEGFADFEARWTRTGAPPRLVASTAPVWRGEDPAGRRLLIDDEQGLGDLLQFSRYLPALGARGADVTLVCRPGMQRLLAGLGPGIRLLAPGDPLPAVDAARALVSLPLACGTTTATVPAPTPLVAEPERVAVWADRIGREGFRIGVCWRGSQTVQPQRSFTPALLAPLAALPGVRLISLVADAEAGERADAALPRPIESLGGDFDKGPDRFIDAAAAIAALDLVVTCDTAIAHLAGSLGKPVFVALRHAADWRWLRARDDTPWYPTMRLFRQPAPGAWGPVFTAVAAAVAARRGRPED